MNPNFDFEVTQHIATIFESLSSTLEINRVSFCGNYDRYDLRRWGRDGDGNRIPLKGLQLYDDEYAELKKFFKSL